MADSDNSRVLAEERTDWAEDRTDWAEDRTALANERTFAGWMRTGMAALALALGLKALFHPFEPTWLPKLVATVFVAVALLIFWTARQRACRTLVRLHTHDAADRGTRNVTLIAGSLSAGALAAGVILWLL